MIPFFVPSPTLLRAAEDTESPIYVSVLGYTAKVKDEEAILSYYTYIPNEKRPSMDQISKAMPFDRKLASCGQVCFPCCVRFFLDLTSRRYPALTELPLQDWLHTLALAKVACLVVLF